MSLPKFRGKSNKSIIKRLLFVVHLINELMWFEVHERRIHFYLLVFLDIECW